MSAGGTECAVSRGHDFPDRGPAWNVDVARPCRPIMNVPGRGCPGDAGTDPGPTGSKPASGFLGRYSL
jgi:hypothetical protein